MKPAVSFICCILIVCSFLLCSPSGSCAAELRTCSVKEVLKGGMYVYLRCQEKGKDVWLATVDRVFKTDEVVTFMDVEPMKNFYSKQLNRTFPEIIFMDYIPPARNK